MSFAETIKKGRKNLGLTLQEASAHFQSKGVSMSVPYLSDFENGRATKIKMDFIYEASALYGINPDELCIAAGRIPKDIFYKIVNNPHIFKDIRNLEV